MGRRCPCRARDLTGHDTQWASQVVFLYLGKQEREPWCYPRGSGRKPIAPLFGRG
jgi:hypothetical protein